MKLGEAIASKMIQYENHLRIKFLFKKKLIKTITINYLKIIIYNAIILKKKLKEQSAKKAKIKVFKDMNLKFLRFSSDHSRDIIIHFQYNQHFDLHVRLQASLMKTIQWKFIQWKLAIESQAKNIKEEKLLLLIIAKHFLKVLDSERLQMLILTKANESLNQLNFIFSKLFIIKLLQRHVCRCITCQFEIEATLKKKSNRQRQEEQISKDWARCCSIFNRKV